MVEIDVWPRIRDSRRIALRIATASETKPSCIWWLLPTLLSVGGAATTVPGIGAAAAIYAAVLAVATTLAIRAHRGPLTWRFWTVDVSAKFVDVWFIGYYGLLGLGSVVCIVAVLVLLVLAAWTGQLGW